MHICSIGCSGWPVGVDMWCRSCRPEVRIRRWIREKIRQILNLLKTFEVWTLSNLNDFVTFLPPTQTPHTHTDTPSHTCCDGKAEYVCSRVCHSPCLCVWKTADQNLMPLVRNICCNEPSKWLDFGDLWPWELELRACVLQHIVSATSTVVN